MCTIKQLRFKINLNSLICSSYTLVENNKIFKKLSLQNDIYLGAKGCNEFFADIEYFYEFRRLLNTTALQTFGCGLIKTILSNSNYFVTSNDKNEIVTKEISNETRLFKKYLKKFKYNYRRYFFYSNGNFENFPADKEINSSAVKLLFLLAGV